MKSDKSGKGGEVKAQIDKLVGKAAYGSFRIFGNMPVRPGDDWYGLTAARQDGDDLVLSFETQGNDPWKFEVHVVKPQGLEVEQGKLTIRQASRVSFAKSLDVEHAGKSLKTTSDGKKDTLPFDNELALELY